MCIVAFRYKKDAEYPFVFIGNRDEDYKRPSQSLNFWKDEPSILAGRDLRHQGTWLGITKSGRFATLLNHPFSDFQLDKNIEPLSRGNLARLFLAETDTEEAFLNNLKETRHQYDGYHFLFGTIQNLMLYSNSIDRIIHFEEGIYSLSNNESHLSEFKLRRSKVRFEKYLKEFKKPKLDGLISLFYDKKTNSNIPSIPKDISLEDAIQNTSIFVKGDRFGTVGTTAIIVDKDGYVKCKEVRYNQENQIMDETEHSFKIEI